MSQAHQQSVRSTRALLCELVANRILRRFHEDNPGSQGLLLLAQILVGGFDPFQGASEEVRQEQSTLSWTTKTRTGYKRKLPALEIAIITESKTFLSSSACQRVVSAIYEGRVVYTPTSFIDILPDHYKQKPISLYNPRKAPMFNQYRLIVPRTRNILEICQFMILLVLFLLVMADRDPSTFGFMEVVFIVYTCGWVLDQFSSILEHGSPSFLNTIQSAANEKLLRLACIHPKPLVLPGRNFLCNFLDLPRSPPAWSTNRQARPRSPSHGRSRHGCTCSRSPPSIQPYVREHAFHLPARNDARLYRPHCARRMVFRRFLTLYDVAQ